MASRKIQATLSERSSARVDQIKLAHTKVGMKDTSDSAAVNALIEILCDMEYEALCEEGFQADSHNQDMRENGV